MNQRVVVDLATLRAVVSGLLDHLEASEAGEVLLDHDMFWSMDVSEMFNVYSRPDNLTIGQLSESWASLLRMIDEDRPLMYGLVWLADVLRVIGLSVAE